MRWSRNVETGHARHTWHRDAVFTGWLRGHRFPRGKVRHHEQRIDRSILPLVLKPLLRVLACRHGVLPAAVATTWWTVLGNRAPDGGPSASGAPSWCPAEWNAGSMSCRRTASLPRTHTSGACPRSTGRNIAGRIESNNSRESILKHPFLGPHRNHTLVRIPEYLTLHRPVVSLLRPAGNECLLRLCSSVGLLVCLRCDRRNRIANLLPLW